MNPTITAKIRKLATTDERCSSTSRSMPASQATSPAMADSGKSADAIVREKGLVQVSDSSAIDPIVDAVIAGNPDEVVEQLKPFVEAGYRHLICGFPPPYDDETMRRMATEVRPELEAYLAR